jgi:hypothetical protein
MGSFVCERDPNYVLLSKATKIIQRFLDIDQNDDVDHLHSTSAPEAIPSTDSWFNLLNPDPWNLETGFWSNLGEHSFFSQT